MKKIRFLAAMLLVVMLMSACALADVVVSTNVNLRSGAGTGYRVICSVPAGSHMDYLGEKCGADGEVDWYQVRFEGQKGWIFAEHAEYDGVPTVIASSYDLSNIDSYTDISVYFGKEIAESAQEIGLIGYQESLHDGVKKYFDDKITFSGVENVDLIALFGGEYTVFGVAPGLEIAESAMMLDEKGIVFTGLDEKYWYFGSTSEENGYNTAMRIGVQDDIVISIEWKLSTAE